jgi:hypothetical protein
VEHWVLRTFLVEEGPQEGTRSRTSFINLTNGIVLRLHEFSEGKGTPWRKFTDEHCQEFLRWCSVRGGRRGRKRGKPLAPSVIHAFRAHLVAISKAAHAVGLMPRRLFLERVGPPRPAKPSTKGQTRSSASSKKGEKGKRRLEWFQRHKHEHPDDSVELAVRAFNREHGKKLTKGAFEQLLRRNGLGWRTL